MTYYQALGVEITGSPNHVVLHAAQNPVTRSQPKLVPPIELNSADDAEGFYNWLVEYCLAAWKDGLQDPAVIDASNWHEDHPSCD